MIRLLMIRQVTDPGPNKPSSSRSGSSGSVYVYGVRANVPPQSGPAASGTAASGTGAHASGTAVPRA